MSFRLSPPTPAVTRPLREKRQRLGENAPFRQRYRELFPFAGFMTYLDFLTMSAPTA